MGKNAVFNGQSAEELVRKRTSVRTYKGQQFTDDVKQKLTRYLNDVRGPFNAEVRFMVIENHNTKDTEFKLGTYGVIKNPPAFILAAVEKKDMYMEQLGYEFEKVILYATSLGLGTCWMGGTFRKGEFAKAAGIKENEELPIVSPVGYPADNKGLLERVMRLAAGSANRKPWQELFFNNNFSSKLSNSEAGRYALPLEMIRLAPSASNKQPWRVVMKNGLFHFYLQHAKGYSSALGFDIQKVDMGIAMCHFELALHDYGIEGKWIIDKPDIAGIPDNTEYIVSWETT